MSDSQSSGGRGWIGSPSSSRGGNRGGAHYTARRNNRQFERGNVFEIPANQEGIMPGYEFEGPACREGIMPGYENERQGFSVFAKLNKTDATYPRDDGSAKGFPHCQDVLLVADSSGKYIWQLDDATDHCVDHLSNFEGCKYFRGGQFERCKKLHSPVARQQVFRFDNVCATWLAHRCKTHDRPGRQVTMVVGPDGHEVEEITYPKMLFNSDTCCGGEWGCRSCKTSCIHPTMSQYEWLTKHLQVAGGFRHLLMAEAPAVSYEQNMKYKAFLDHYNTRTPRPATLLQAFLARQQDRIEFESSLYAAGRTHMVYEQLPPGGLPDSGVSDDWWQNWYTAHWMDGSRQLKGYPYGSDGLGHMDVWQPLLTAPIIMDSMGVVGPDVYALQRLPYGMRPYQEQYVTERQRETAKAEAARAKATKAAAEGAKTSAAAPKPPQKAAPPGTGSKALSTVAAVQSSTPMQTGKFDDDESLLDYEDTEMTTQSESLN